MATISKDSELGTLIVIVLKARNLIDKHSFYKQDAFARVVLNGVTKQTHVDVKGGQHPVWDSEQRFSVTKVISDKTRTLQVSCYAKESRSDGLLGKGTVDITDTLKTGEFDEWVSLSIDGVSRGEVYLEMTYFSSGPRPAIPSSPRPSPGHTSLTVPLGQDLTRRPSKLSPSERLSRPPQSLAPSQGMPTKFVGSPMSTPSGHPTSQSSSKHKNSALPPVPETQSMQTTLPEILHPGRTSQLKPQPGPGSSETLPPSLRPGKGNALVPKPLPPDRAHLLSLSHSPPSNPRLPRRSSPSFGPSSYDPSPSSNPYLSKTTPPPPISPVTPPNNTDTVSTANYFAYPNPITPSAKPPAWDQIGGHTADLSFPMPMIPQPDLLQTTPYQNYGHHQVSPDVHSTPTPDRYLSARYTAPLPLPDARPNFTSSSPRGRQPDINTAADEPKALSNAEGEANRREQERRDLELALQLDKQLNT